MNLEYLDLEYVLWIKKEIIIYAKSATFPCFINEWILTTWIQNQQSYFLSLKDLAAVAPNWLKAIISTIGMFLLIAHIYRKRYNAA